MILVIISATWVGDSGLGFMVGGLEGIIQYGGHVDDSWLGGLTLNPEPYSLSPVVIWGGGCWSLHSDLKSGHGTGNVLASHLFP